MGGIIGGGPSIPAPVAPPPLPKREDPAVAQAREDQRQAELRRRGRAASILAGEGGDAALGAGTTIERPQAQAAKLLGG